MSACQIAADDGLGMSASGPLTDNWPDWLPRRRHRSVPDIPVDALPQGLATTQRGRSDTWSVPRRSQTTTEQQLRDAAFLRMVEHFKVRVVHPDGDFSSLSTPAAASDQHADANDAGDQRTGSQRHSDPHTVSSQPRGRPERRAPPDDTMHMTTQAPRSQEGAQRRPPHALKRKWRRLRRWLGLGRQGHGDG